LGVISSLLRLFLLSGAIIIQATIDIVTWAVVLSDFAFFGLMAVSAFYSFHTLQYHPFRTPIKVITQHGEPIRTFLISNNLAGTMRIISSKLDVIVIAALSSPAVVALYKVAARIAGTVIMFSDPLLLALYPEMSHLHASNSTQQLKRIVSSLTKTLTLLATSVVIGFVVFGNWVLNHIVGVQYTDAFSVVLIMFIGTSVAMIFFWARPLLLVSGVAGKLVLVGVASIVLQFVVLYFLVPTMGAKGAGIALTVHYLINISLLLYLVITSVEFLPLKNEIENA
jgi:O-antigen/teichoic acid export membrane protein